MELKGSRTEQNLMAAFAGESQARNKYTYYASKAKKDGFEQIAAIFEETANNEKEHAKMWFKELHGGEIPTTAQNLLDAAEGENYEWTDMHFYLKKWLKSKKNMKKDIENYLLMLKINWSLVKMVNVFGYAVIVDIFILVNMPQKFAQSVHIQKLTLN